VDQNTLLRLPAPHGHQQCIEHEVAFLFGSPQLSA
jgi:hypothetical protein